MRTIRCIAVDDEPMALLVIEQFCRRKGGLLLETFSEPHVGLEAIRRTRPELVFLDIEMNGISGLEIAGSLPAGCCLIFTTAHARYALEGFELDAVDFLHKPFAYERFETAVERAFRRIESLRAPEDPHLVVKQEYNNVSIPCADILYIEALGNYVKIVRASGGHVLTRANLKAVSDMLPEGRFLRIHRSYVVALGAVEAFTRSRVTLRGGVTLSIGQQYASAVLRMLGS